MGRVFAASDWHGHYDLGKRALDLLTADDKLYFLGDSMDRGPDGVKVLNLLLNDKRVIFLKGNHEEFFQEYMPHLRKEDYSNVNYAAIWLEGNGGWPTYMNTADYSKSQIDDMINAINNLPLYTKYINKNGQIIHLSHAGFTPDHRRDRFGVDYLWDRDHLRDNWSFTSFLEEEYDSHDNDYIVHGHTPVQCLYHYKANGDLSTINKDKPDIFRYCEGHKFDIDLGTIKSKRIGLLDLDTFESIYIEER